MGGGASKGSEGDSKANRDAPKDSPRAAQPSPTGNQNEQKSSGMSAGMSCTVIDAVTNTHVPFQSSVALGKPSKKKRRDAAHAQSADQLNDDENPIDEPIMYIGDAVINGAAAHHAHSSNASRLAASQTSDRGDINSALSVLYDSPARLAPGHVSVLVGGVTVSGAPSVGNAVASVGTVTPTQQGLSPTTTPPSNADVTGKYTPQQRAAVFASKIKFAIPIDFNIKPVGGQSTAIRTIAASADGTLFASVFAGGKSAQYFDGLTGQLIMEIRAHLDPIVAIAHSRDGKFLLTSSNDGNVCLWDLNNGKKLREISVTSQANAVAISDDSDTIATSSTEDFVNLWESRNGEALTMFQRHSGSVYSVAFSRRGGLVASGSQNGEVFVWGSQAGDVRLHIETGARTAVMHVAFNQDGTRLLTADRDVLQVWDLFTGGLIFSRNGSGDVSLGEEGKSMHQPTFVTAPKELPRITSAAFGACNNIVCGLTSKKIVVLDPNAGTELLSLDVRALVTCISTNWAGDVIFFGDYTGNHYRLTLSYAHRDAIDFNLFAKPPSKEKGKADRD